MNWQKLFPPKQNEYTGSKWSLYFLVVLGIKDIFRSIVHYFTPDGGSGIIAGLPLASYSDDAVKAIINSFAVYGAHQLVFAILIWIILFRYRRFIPMLYLLICLTELLGAILFLFKPLPVTPPGQLGVYVLLPLSLFFLLLSLKKPKVINEEND